MTNKDEYTIRETVIAAVQELMTVEIAGGTVKLPSLSLIDSQGNVQRELNCKEIVGAVMSRLPHGLRITVEHLEESPGVPVDLFTTVGKALGRLYPRRAATVIDELLPLLREIQAVYARAPQVTPPRKKR